MSFDVKKVGVFSRRAFIVTVLKLLAFFIIFGRLFHLQVFSHKKYLDKSTNNHTKSFVIPPKRGMIFDINGERIAYNAKYWRVVFKGKKKNFSVVQKVLNILEVSQVQQEYILEQYKKNPFEEFVIYEFLSQSQLTNIEINIPSLPGIYAVEGVARYYKNDIAYSNIIGYAMVSE
jgi:penicillin-binding protein 2